MARKPNINNKRKDGSPSFSCHKAVSFTVLGIRDMIGMSRNSYRMSVGYMFFHLPTE